MKQNEQEFTTLVRKQRAAIYSVCYMFADSIDEASDLFQEVLVNLWRGFETFRGDSSPNTWVYRVSLNTCLTFDRKKKRRRKMHEEVEIDPSLPDGHTDMGAPSRLLHERIGLLEPFDRAIVLLWLEDMSYDDIGAIVGISSKAVGVRLVRIREKLKSLGR